MHARARLGEQGAHGAPCIALQRELAAGRGVFGKPFPEACKALHQRAVPIDGRARAEHRHGGLQLPVELLGAPFKLVACGARFIKGGQRFAEGAQFHGDASHTTRVALGHEPTQGCDKAPLQGHIRIGLRARHGVDGAWRAAQCAVTERAR